LHVEETKDWQEVRAAVLWQELREAEDEACLNFRVKFEDGATVE